MSDSNHSFIKVSESDLRNLIQGALLDTINQHGPITKELLGSAVKRIVPRLSRHITENMGEYVVSDC